jgi:hypothetical protein
MNPIDLPFISAGSTVILPVLLIIFGLLNCFFGYRLFKAMLALWGLLLGAVVGAIVAGNVTEGQTLWLVVGALVGGIAGAVLLRSLYVVGVFVVGGLAGWMLANGVGSLLSIEMPLLVLIIVAVVGGVAALILQRVAIVLATAIAGGWAIVRGLSMLLTDSEPVTEGMGTMAVAEPQAGLPILIVLGILGIFVIVGAVIQLRTTDEEGKE